MRKKQLLRTGISILMASAMMITSIPATSNAASVDEAAAPVEATAAADGNVEGREAGYYLMVYTTETNFYESTGNVGQETRSVYMAVSRDGQNYDVLNNGGGVIFAKTGSNMVKAPQIYRTEEGFKVIAQDSTASNGYHVFTSKDGVAYYTDTLAKDGDDDYGSEEVLSKEDCTLMLKGENILDTDTKITLGNALEVTEAEYKHIVDKLGTVVNTGLDSLAAVSVSAGANVEKVLADKYPSVNATYSDGSTQAFNIDWSGAASAVNLSQMGTYSVTGTVKQTKYLNNLKEINGSTLLEDDPENANPDFPSNYDPDTKTVYYDKTKFVEGMADPNVYWDEETGYYYMTGSYFPEESDKDRLKGDEPDQYDRVVLRRGRTLEELQDRSKQVTIWKVGNQGYQDQSDKTVTKGYRYIWAPELHRVGDYWVVYFTEAHSSSDLYSIYSHALVLSGELNPYEDTALEKAGDVSAWQDYQMRGGSGKTDAIVKSFCLDMTYFEDEENGEPYVIWASKGEGNSKLYIAKVDKERPWVINSEIVLLTEPEYGWENVRYDVNEGPTVLQKNDRVFMCYSASGTGSEYAIGMMTADQGTDLLDLSNWTKNPYPLLTSRDVDGEEGPGHNSFTVDQDGNDIFVYHARPTTHNDKHCGWNGTKSLHYNSQPLNDPCRHARLKRVHWAADGTPILRMTYEDELTEENQTVSVQVVVPGIKLDKTTLSLNVGQSDDLKADVFSASGTNVSWESSDNSVATVANGKVTAKKAGTATITATQADGMKATCTVTVNGSASNVKLDKTSHTMGVGQSITLKVSGAKSVTWSSSSNSIATVNKGKVTAKKAGTATITANADGVNLTCKITVKAAPKKLTLKSKKNVVLKKNKTSKISVKLPKNTMADLAYKSANKKIATVDANGKIKAKKKGKTKITVTAKNNKKAKVTVNVTVK